VDHDKQPARERLRRCPIRSDPAEDTWGTLEKLLVSDFSRSADDDEWLNQKLIGKENHGFSGGS